MAIALLLFYAAGLAIATFIEKYHGFEAAGRLIYYSPFSFLLLFLLVVNFVFTSLQHHLFRRERIGFLLLHLAWIVILSGALTTRLFGKEGVVRLREGESKGYMTIQTNRGESHHHLPFSLTLEKFEVHRYPGSSSPSAFESHLLISSGEEAPVRKTISMNRVLDRDGYRFFQASFDQDERGTVLSVNRDPVGRRISYAGYALLMAGFIICFLSKRSRFRQLAGRLNRSHRQILLPALFLLPSLLSCSHTGRITSPSPSPPLPISGEHAALFGALPMHFSSGRIAPVNTFSSEILRKLYHADRIGDLDSDHFLLSLLVFPEEWMRLPCLYLPDRQISFNHDLPEGYCAYHDLFDRNGQYKLLKELQEIYPKPPSQRSRYEKNLIRLDEQANIFFMLTERRMVALFPIPGDPGQRWFAPGDDPETLPEKDRTRVESLFTGYLKAVRRAAKSGEWSLADQNLSLIGAYQREHAGSLIQEKKLTAERTYNRLNLFSHCKKTYLLFGGTLLFLSLLLLFGKTTAIRRIAYLNAILILLVLLVHGGGIVLRGYIAGYAPWSNSYETMVYVSFVTVLAGFLFARKSLLTLSLATLFGGIILFVSGLNWMNPQITPLVPVLKSPWLMIHVAVIVAAYGFFGIGFLLGLLNTALFSAKNSRLVQRAAELTLINEMALLIGLALLTMGTFFGAVWANESWGRYWGWDPKETWALITIIVYTVLLHLRLVKRWDNPVLFNRMAVLAFFAVLMTYFGVNYLLSGMHSYG